MSPEAIISKPNAKGSSSAKTGINGTNDDLASAVKARRSRDRELERKRERGEISCAECKRLKLKCNKKVPCASCVRRGCHTICPNGSLSSGHGTRFVLANTDKLHSKLLDMSKRIRQLEDALHIAHTSISPNSHPHPLLTDELLAVKAGVDMPENEDASDEVPELALSLGTLAISHGGRSLFVGNAGSEALLLERCGRAVNTNVPDKSLDEALASLPEEFKHLAEGFPFASTTWSKKEMRKLIKSHLPTYSRASSLIEAYLENMSWFCRPVERDQIMEEILPALYKREWVDGSDDDGPDSEESPEMHQLALSMALFSCGAVVDLTLPPYNPEGIIFNHLARAALSLKSVFEGSSFETVQTIILLSKFEYFVSRKTSLESAWKLMSFGLVLASSIGLHRDPARWNLDKKIVERRRHLYWEIFPIDKWKSLGSGRPSIFHVDEMDCEPPEIVEDPEGKGRIPGFSEWKYRFTKEILAPTAEYLGKVRSVKYSDILEFDRKLREFPDYPDPDIERMRAANGLDSRRLMWRRYKDILSLFLHRNFFARAMIDEPVNPLRSHFAPSFLAAYSTSISYLKSSRSAYAYCPQMFDRAWTFWAHALVAAVMIGSVACRTAPSLASLTAAAREELNVSVIMFEKVVSHPVVHAGLPIVLRLRDKAFRIQQQQELGYPRSVDLKIEDDEAYKELHILKGTSRTVTENLDGKSNSKSSGKSSGSAKVSPELSGSSSGSDRASPAATAATVDASQGSSTPASFSKLASNASAKVSSPSIFTDPGASSVGVMAAPLSSEGVSGWASSGSSMLQDETRNETGTEQKTFDQWDLWADIKLNQPGFTADPATDGVHSTMGPWAPTDSDANTASETLAQPINGSGGGAQPWVESMSDTDWSELGLRAVLESLNNNAQMSPPSTDGSVPAPGSFNTGAQQSYSTFPADFSNAPYMVDNTATFGFPDFGSAPESVNQSQSFNQTQNGGPVGAQSEADGTNGLDGMLMDTTDASLMEAWRTMSEFPSFVGLDTAGFM